MNTVVIERKTKTKATAKPVMILQEERNPLSLQRARARAHDNSAGRKLKAALARKAVTEARLKALGMPLKPEKD
jgi:hypothetical protein